MNAQQIVAKRWDYCGVILNAAELTASDIAAQRVLCPGRCTSFVEMTP